MRVRAEVGQRPGDQLPAERGGQPPRRRPHLPPELRCGGQRDQRRPQPVHVAGRDDGARARRRDHVGELVAGGADQRQPAPQVVQHPGTEGELGLQVVQVRAHRDVGGTKPAVPVLVGHPAVGEEDGPVQQSLLLGDPAGRGGGAVDAGHRMLRAEEDQPQPGHLGLRGRDRADQRHRVQPGIDAAAPHADHVLGADAGEDRGQRGPVAVHRRSRRRPERHDADEPGEVGGVVVGDRVDPAQRGEVAEPQRPLAPGGAQHEVGPGQLDVQRGDAVAHHRAAGRLGQPAGPLELLEVERVVGVDHDRDRGVDQPGVQPEDVALHDDRADPAQQRGQVPGGGRRDQPDGRVVDLHRAERRDGHRADPGVRGECAGQLEGADRRSGHPHGQRFSGDQQDPRPARRGRGQAPRPSGSHR